MALIASDIMRRAGILLQDEDHLRWTLPELAEWINDATRSIVLAKPSESTAIIHIELEPGTLQQVPSGTSPVPQLLMSLTRNLRQIGPPVLGGRTITPTNRGGLESAQPDWHDERRVRRRRDVMQFFIDDQDPLRFWVYPGNDGTGIVEALVAVLPTPIAPTGDETLIASWDVPIGLKEIMATPMLDYVLYRAQSKDDVAANAGRAQAHFQTFATAVGIKTSSETRGAPGRHSNG